MNAFMSQEVIISILRDHIGMLNTSKYVDDVFRIIRYLRRKGRTTPGVTSLPEEILGYIQVLSRAAHLEEAAEKMDAMSDERLERTSCRVAYLECSLDQYIDIPMVVRCGLFLTFL